MSDSGPWGMGFELFCRLVAEAQADADVREAAQRGRPGVLTDEALAACASTARRAVRIWRDTRPREAPLPRPLPATLPSTRVTP